MQEITLAQNALGENMSFLQPTNFYPETTTVWDFPDRGSWATHKSDYRGNFAPQIPRNVIINYSKEGDLVLDPMVGSGTTLIEARLLNRNAIGCDINQSAVNITKNRINFEVDNLSKQDIRIGDVRNLQDIIDNSIDLVVTHPPYLDLVTYSNRENPDDLSSISDIPRYMCELERGIKELFRVLKPEHFCSILIGDTRKGQHYIPLSHYVLQLCLRSGFVLKEEIIKTQHNTKFEKRWINSAKQYKFYLIMHEHLYIFRKPKNGEKLTNIKYSSWEGFLKVLNLSNTE